MIDSPRPNKPKAVNVGAQRVASIYAQAFLGAAESAGRTDALVDELNGVAELLGEHPQLQAVLASALIAPEEKSQVLDRVFGGQVTGLVLDFLKVVARHGRLEIVQHVASEVQKMFDELRGRVRVELQTAVPLAEGQAASLEASLRRILGGEPQVEPVVDPALIGGVVLRVGDTVYDGSVARQLAQVREQMINRSVHEIQSRRDSFRHSGGN